MKKTKVLEVLPGLNYGGSQSMIINICEAFDKNIVQCDFIIDHEDKMDMASVVESFGSSIYIMPSFKGVNLIEVIKAWENFFSKHKEYRIIHCHIRSYASIILYIAKKHGLKTIIHSHNTSNGKGIGSVLKNVLQLPLRRIADYFMACSLEAGEWLYGERITKGDNFYVINNAIDTDKYSFNNEVRVKYRDLFGLKNQRVFIQIGRMTEQKNYLFTLDTYSKYLRINGNSKLFIVGDGEMEMIIQKKIRELGIMDNVIVLKNRDDVNCLLQMADVFLMPSLYEGLSVAAIEAQTSGIDCICSSFVNKNVNITGLCDFLPLDQRIWVNRMGVIKKKRETKRQFVIDAGYDVKTTAKWLESFYKNIA